MPKRFSWSEFWKLFSKPRWHQPRQVSIYRSLPLGMTVVVAVTVFVGAVSAIALVWRQLDNQVRLRIQSAQSSTQALYNAERRDILQLVQLVSERPTLCALLQNPPDVPKLTSYLDVLRRRTTVDTLALVAPTGQSIISGSLEFSPEVFLEYSELPFADFVVLSDPTRLAIVGIGDVTSTEGCTNGLPGRVIVIQVLDHNFMRNLASDTGLEQSLIVDGHRVATSFINITNWPLNPDVATLVSRTQEACCTMGASGDEKYYVGLAPLLDKRGNVIALSEVALYANTIRNGALSTIALFLAISVLAGLVSGALTFPLSRRITDPLLKLSDAAELMGSGDLDTPIPISSGWITIDRLAGQLDHARRNLRQIQQVTRRELRRVVHLLGATREGVLTINVEGHITWANTDACQILGYDILDLLRKHYSEIFRPAPGEIITLTDILRPQMGRSIPGYLTILNSKDSGITLSISRSVMSREQEDAKEAYNEHVLIIKDVSEEQSINRLRSEFLANLAHEFRTPLSAISASTELLLDEGRDMSPDELSHLADTIYLSTVHLQALVNNLLESAVIEAGLFHLRYRLVDVSYLVRDITQMMSPLLQQRHQRLKVDIPPDLPGISGDPDRLHQALVNLVENASKFSPSAATIELTVNQDDMDAVTFAVLDSGPGLPGGEFGDLFKRFVTGERPGATQYGIGLGLPIVKAIVEAHGGHVGAENRPEGGARVWFVIPLKQPSKEGEIT